MAEFPALPIWTDALLGDTMHLSASEFGAYMLMLIVAWRSKECSLPNNDESLARICRMDRRRWNESKATLRTFFTIGSDGMLHQKRLDAVRQNVGVSVEQKKAAGRASALKRLDTGSTAVERPLNGCLTNQNQNQNQEERKSSKQEAAPPPEPCPAKDEIIKAFDETIVRVFGAERMHPHPTDKVFAQRWRDDGLKLPEIRLFFEGEMRKIQASGRAKPSCLKFFDGSIREALASGFKQKTPVAIAQNPHEEPWKFRVKSWIERKSWFSNWGDPPDSPNCQCPREILHEMGIAA